MIFGMCVGGTIMYKFMLEGRRKFILKLQEESALKTDLLNWVISEGIYLEEDEFYPQYQEKARFINMVVD